MGKLQLKWMEPYWIIKEFKGSYQLGTLVGEVPDKWENGAPPHKEQAKVTKTINIDDISEATMHAAIEL